MGQYKKQLTHIILNSVQFYQILDEIPEKYLNNVPDDDKNDEEGIHNYYYGYKYCPKGNMNKLIVTYGKIKGLDYMIIRKSWLYFKLKEYLPNYKELIGSTPSYIQCVVECRTNFPDIIQYQQNPTTLFHKFNKIIDKHYTQEEKDECYFSHQLTEQEAKHQIHINQPENIYKINNYLVYKFNDCVKYDINGAHCDALCEIFPKAKNDILKLYEKRKKKGNEWIKAMFNMSVGYLNIPKLKKKYGGTYWWIVNRTTEILNKAIDELGGTIIYANTDGVCVQHPKKLMENSKELGKFKLEYQGDVYYHRHVDYMIYEFGESKVGSCRLAARDYVNLKEGKVVNYTLINQRLDEKNIKKEVLKIICVE